MRRFLILATVLGGGLSTACGDSTGPGAIFGTYELVSIDGEVLPILGVPILVEGSIELRSDMAYLKRLTFLIGENEDVLVFGGHFTVAGSTIDFGDLGTGTVSGNTLTVTEDSEVWVYRR